MNSIPKDVILQFNEDTMQSVRKEYNLDKPEINKAIDSLEEWVIKQNHFIKKDFSRDYLETLLLSCKGSVERAKTRLDRACTLRTLMPTLFQTINFKTDYKDSNVIMGAFLPKLTDDHYRVYLVKFIGNRFDNGFTNYFRFVVSIAEYLWAHDYSKGITIVIDYLDVNMMEIIKKTDISEVRQLAALLIEGYGLRVKDIHILTTSKAIEILISIFKQVLSAKILARVRIHKDLELLHKVLSKNILPEEQGGNEKSLKILHEEWLSILSSIEHQEYFNKIKAATINEKTRLSNKFNEEFMGIAGTFRNLSVD